MSSVAVVLQQDGAIAHTSNWVQHFLLKSKISPSGLWQIPTHWTTPSGRILRPRRAMLATQTLPSSEHPSTENECHMCRDYVIKWCRAFRRRLESIIASDGGYNKLNETINTVFKIQKYYFVCSGRLWGIKSLYLRFTICSVFFSCQPVIKICGTS